MKKWNQTNKPQKASPKKLRLPGRWRQLQFEYSAEALQQGLELSPRHLAWRAPSYSDFPSHQIRLPGLVTDIVAGKDSDAPTLLALMGGTPHGARPKVLVHLDAVTGFMSTHPFEGSKPWLLKFHAQDEHKEVCAIEMLHAEMARAYGPQDEH